MTTPAPSPGPTAFVLVGATATGKSEVAHLLARRYQRGVLSADSMMVYRGMDIGTAKPTLAEREGIPYWGIDLVEASEDFNTARYLDHAHQAFREAGDLPLIVTGGTGLYLSGLMLGLDDLPPADPQWREEAQALLDEGGKEALQDAVREKSPSAFAALKDKENPRRLIRAYETANQGPTRRSHGGEGPPVIGLKWPREMLYERIERRVRSMYRNGLLEEVEQLRSTHSELSQTAAHAIGYREAADLLDGLLTPDQAVEKTVLRTRQLAKRQGTWFRNQAHVDWVDVTPVRSPEDLADEVESRWKQHGQTRIHI